MAGMTSTTGTASGMQQQQYGSGEREMRATETTTTHLQSEMSDQPRSISDQYRGCGKLRGKVAMITGGDSGIGRAVAVAFAREGANVVVCYLNEHEDAKEVVQMVAKEGSHAIALAGDVSSEAFAQDAVAKTLNAFGRIDILVNNAATQCLCDSIRDIGAKQLANTFAVNVYSAFFLTKAVLPHLQQGGAIINSTSVAAYKGRCDMLDYAATKGALTAFTYSLAQSPEVLQKNIRVNAVAAGHTWTPAIEATYSGEKMRTFGADTPMKRPAQPDEIAPSYVFLASEVDSSYMTGQVLHPNGGQPVHC